MINIPKLKGIIVEKGFTQEQIAEKLGLSSKTFYDRMKKGVFGSDEMDKMIEILSIENPTPIFFAQCVTLKDTN